MSGKKRYPLRIPRYVAGIRSQESRMGQGRSWWAKRWLDILEAMQLKGRLGRGKNYAMSGQVMTMEIEGNRLVSRVQGARENPYEVRLDFDTPAPAARTRIVAAIRAEPILVARLLTDDLPLEVEEIFKREGAHLFPGGKLGPGRYDMTTECSCPDYANPCKHTVAALFILGEEVARRPATLLELRGIRMEELYEN